MRYGVLVNGSAYDVTVSAAGVEHAGVVSPANVQPIDGTPVVVVSIGSRRYRVVPRRSGQPGQYAFELGGFSFSVEAVDERTRAIRQLATPAARDRGAPSVRAPMPGLVVRVLVKAGDAVESGQGLVVIEAMKMENELRAPTAGVVASIAVTAGSPVEKGAVLVEFESTR